MVRLHHHGEGEYQTDDPTGIGDAADVFRQERKTDGHQPFDSQGNDDPEHRRFRACRLLNKIHLPRAHRIENEAYVIVELARQIRMLDERLLHARLVLV